MRSAGTNFADAGRAGSPRAGAMRSAHTNVASELADAGRVDQARSAKTRTSPTPVALTGAVGTNKLPDAGRFDRSGRQQKTPPSEICLTEPGVSGQRRLSVGGAVTRSRHRSLGDPRTGQATGAREAARGYAATVGFRRANCRRRSSGPERSGADEFADADRSGTRVRVRSGRQRQSSKFAQERASAISVLTG